MSTAALRWRVTLARRRLFAWNVAVPFLLLTPVALSEAARPHRAAVFAVFIAFFGAFGTCIPLLRDAATGWIDKLQAAGIASRRWLLERLGAELAIDILQLAPVLAVYALSAHSGAATWVEVPLGLVLALSFAAVTGATIAGLVRSLAEGALVCAAVSLLLLHLAGVFRAPAPDTWASVVATWSPYRPLHLALLGSPLGLRDWLTAGLSTGVGVALLTGLAPRLASRWGWPYRV